MMSTSDLWRSAPARATELAVNEVYRSDKFAEHGKAEISVRLLGVLRNLQSALKIRCPDDCLPLTKDELKALGLRGSLKIDRVYWDALSPAGQADPIGACEVLFHRASAAISFEGTLRQAKSAGLKNCKLYANPERACAMAIRMDRSSLAISATTCWPPPECDAPWCSCAFAIRTD